MVRLISFFLLVWLVPSFIASAVTIWPLMPSIKSGERATAIYLENTSSETKSFQIRVRDWRTEAGNDVMQAQSNIMASPAMLEIDAGQRQLVRLVYLSEPRVPAFPTEQSYRVIVDDISERTELEGNINMRMRYILPLFVGASDELEIISSEYVQATIELQGDKATLVVQNTGPRHLRLSAMSVLKEGEPLTEHDGLLGYVLPQSSNSFALPESLRPHLEANSYLTVQAKHGRTVLEIPADIIDTARF